MPPVPTEDLFLPGGAVRPNLLEESTLCVLEQALVHTRRTQWESLRTPHIFMGLLTAPDRTVRDWCLRVGVDAYALFVRFEGFFQNESGEPVPPLRLNREFISDNAIRTLREAHQRALNGGRHRIAPFDLLVTIFAAPAGIVAECFERIGFAPKKLLELAILAGSRNSRT